MTRKRTITVPVWNRPDLFDEMLQSLARCPGLENWHIFVNVEPGPDQDSFAQICKAVMPDQSVTVRINRRQLGVRGNHFDLLEHVFSAGTELNICLEEDLLVTPDILDLAEWYKALDAPHLACLNLVAGACGNPGYMSDTRHPDLFFETKCFNSYGVVLTPRNWQRLRSAWLGPDTGLYRHPDKSSRSPDRVSPRYLDIDGWDWAISGEILLDPALSVLQPVAARCYHAGAQGTYSNPEFHDRAFGHVDLTETTLDTGKLRISSVADLPRMARAHVESLNHCAELMSDLYDSRYPRPPLLIRLINQMETRLWGHPVTRR